MASDGGIFALGNATFHGAATGQTGSYPVVSIASTPDGRGYWIVNNGGRVFNEGDAGSYGLSGSFGHTSGAAVIVPSGDGNGYFVMGRNGAAHVAGDAVQLGPFVIRPLNAPVVGAAGW